MAYGAQSLIAKVGRRFNRLFPGLMLVLVACDNAPDGPSGATREAQPEATTPVVAAPVRADTTLVLAFGDSLTAGYGLPQDQSYPARLEAVLQASGADVRIQNAGVSGDTTTGGKARLDWVLKSLPKKPDLVIMALGANDALRGVDPAQTRANIDDMLSLLRAQDIPVLVAGMAAPRNLGTTYTQAFDSIFPDLAAKYDLPLYPFLLDGVVLDPDLNQSDGIHPNERGVAIIVERILPFVRAALP